MEPKTFASFERFALGIAEIDAQHMRLFELLKEIKSWNGTDLETPANMDVLSLLADYAKTHFAVEESVMRMLRYPDTSAHIADHERFLKALDIFHHRLKNGDRGVNLGVFIGSWLIDHIDRVDRKYVDHFLARGIDPHARP